MRLCRAGSHHVYLCGHRLTRASPRPRRPQVQKYTDALTCLARIHASGILLFEYSTGVRSGRQPRGPDHAPPRTCHRRGALPSRLVGRHKGGQYCVSVEWSSSRATGNAVQRHITLGRPDSTVQGTTATVARPEERPRILLPVASVAHG